MGQFDFKNQVILITGSSGGIGQTTAKLFAECGARVVCVDLNEPEASM
ncbi:MAG: SDR family NAD(P)-dependent oxidoreductase, partial [bacterium]